MVADNNTRVIITMSKELKEQLLAIANEEGRSLSNLIVQITKIYVNEHGNPLPHS